MDTQPTRNPAQALLLVGVALVTLGLASAQDQTPQPQPQQPFLSTGGYGTADSNGRMIAVTGIDITGGSLLYLVDTETRHLSIYQATGGTKSTMKVQWVGARNIDLDLQVDGWNDKSSYPYKELAKEFAGGGDLEEGR